ncbi:Mediator complex subunit Med21 [Penicillium atrosanguineum]|uniref:Uncharacterized protein n=1 Tax=Penicillium atrosanguineum TaxID=1132637 RepID=A0A9W9U1H3_9EURO|nr:Mediator complex subunit Med21 [Penicillium atrosanguineum]KAJ5125607.1 hypothetical protein N7526_007784 [Penicillium atrosanguineum]KAJ5292721.1 Mediator complex subunit Med21 [Penicillium atrosanguineum]KAJ5303254.1 hypothetical protein N7476_010053 [Penicillium atrosanguineum]
MTMAFEQEGSISPGWIQSCWACLSSGEVGQSALRAENRGVEREMQVCHAQPHLVPPMKLVVYDDLPSPSVDHQPHNSLSSWISDGRNLASRASTRASMSFKRQSTVPLKIGAPSDFRRVEGFSFRPSTPRTPPIPTKYQPLELSIYRSGKRLSDLPEFDYFEIDEDRHRQTLAVPPRALSPNGVRAQRCQSANARLSMSRKPVGSGNRRSFRQSEYFPEPAQPVRIPSALVPHFSLVKPVKTVVSEGDMVPVTALVEPISNESQIELDTEWPDHVTQEQASMEAEPQSPLPTKDQDYTSDDPFNAFSFPSDSPSSASSRTMPSRISSLYRPPTSENRNTIAETPMPNRVTQWFFSTGPPSPKQVSLTGEDEFAWERTRTLSGSTVASVVTTTITGGAQIRQHKASISSTFTSDTTPRASIHVPSRSGDKDFEAMFNYPAIPKGRPQHYPFAPYKGEPLRYDNSTVGLAF